MRSSSKKRKNQRKKKSKSKTSLPINTIRVEKCSPRPPKPYRSVHHNPPPREVPLATQVHSHSKILLLKSHEAAVGPMIRKTGKNNPAAFVVHVNQTPLGATNPKTAPVPVNANQTRVGAADRLEAANPRAALRDGAANTKNDLRLLLLPTRVSDLPTKFRPCTPTRKRGTIIISNDKLMTLTATATTHHPRTTMARTNQ